MNIIRTGSIVSVILAGTLGLSACGKKEAPPPPAAMTPAPASTPALAPVTTPAATAAPAAAAQTTVESVDLGDELNASDHTIKQPNNSFTAHSTIFAVVNTNSSGTGTSTISAKWTFQGGQLVNESTQQISASGPAHTAFHINKPSGFPVGKYTLEVSVDGKQASTTSFDVH